MLLGYSRGSVGDVTFYRAGGSQRQRARNRQPNNPRTAKQMTQRSKFANAVKFFKQINTGFFKYAFEDRKTNESDYNAFMRHNVVNSGYIGAQASKIADWPALGLWQLSAGSLPEITAPFPQPATINGIYFDLGVDFSSAEIQTVGDFSNALVNGAPSVWRYGDIFTFVVYRATNANTLPTVDTEEDHTAYAAYGQIILNGSDTTLLDEVPAVAGSVNTVISVDSNGFYLLLQEDVVGTIWNNNLVGFSVIHSRNSANGLLVSSSTMAYNKRELPLLAMYDSGAYYNAVIADWQASADAILQGAAVSSNPLPFGSVGVAFKAGISEIMSTGGQSVPNRSSITFVSSPSAADSMQITLSNLTTALTAADASKITIEGVGAYTYNAGSSEYLPSTAIIAFDLSATLSTKPSGVVVYYDGQVIASLTFV